MVVLACVTAISRYLSFPPTRLAQVIISRFIILSMITRKSFLLSIFTQERIQPTSGSKRAERDSVPFRSTSRSEVFTVNRRAFPKLQYSIKPRSCVPVLFFSFSSTVNFGSVSARIDLSLEHSYQER